MINSLRRLLLLGVTGVFLIAPAARADTDIAVAVNVSRVSDFYEPLGEHGHWVEIAPYGWCWYPSYIPSDWQPYTEGYWLYSDGGWHWVSEEPWAWATYHYGRWLWHPYYRWVWVPGLEWAPAWVAWREGGDYVGWAPLPPDAGLRPWDDYYFDRVVIVPHAFVFVSYGSFCRPIHRRNLIHHRDRHHGDIVNKTVIKTKIKQVNNIVINEGPRVAAIERASGERVRQVRERRELSRAEFLRTEAGRRRSAPVEVIRGTRSDRQAPGEDRAPDRAGRTDRRRDRSRELPEVLRPTAAPAPQGDTAPAPAVRNYRAREEPAGGRVVVPQPGPRTGGEAPQRSAPAGQWLKELRQRERHQVSPKPARPVEAPARAAPAQTRAAEKAAERREAVRQRFEQLVEQERHQKGRDKK